MKCHDCGEWLGPTEDALCQGCVTEVFKGAQEATKQEAHEDVIMLIDDLAAALRKQLEMHADEWRSNEKERPADEEAKKTLARADLWLGIPR